MSHVERGPSADHSATCDKKVHFSVQVFITGKGRQHLSNAVIQIVRVRASRRGDGKMVKSRVSANLSTSNEFNEIPISCC